jgi:hypothetical protein
MTPPDAATRKRRLGARRPADAEAGNLSNTIFGKVLKRARGVHVMIVAYLTTCAASWSFFSKHFSQLYQHNPIAILLIVFGPILFILAFQIAPDAIRNFRRRRLDLLALRRDQLGEGTGYFRLDPYVTPDFKREDNAHVALLGWIESNAFPVIFLSGLSGSGKSSIIEAYLVPKLTEGGWKVSQVRSGESPAATIDEALARPAGSRTRSLIILDQFEEFLILGADHLGNTYQDVLGSLGRLVASERRNVTVLISFRNDYQGAVVDLDIANLNSKTTWREISPFQRTAARRFLHAAPAQPSDGLVEKMLDGIDILDDTPGLYRPIALNILGLALEKYDTHFLGNPSRLIREYLLSALNDGPIRDIAPTVVSSLITSAGTKKPMSASDIAIVTALAKSHVLVCLERLGRNGITRRLSATGEIWELSHDFVARQLRLILETGKVSISRILYRFVLPAAFVIALPIAALLAKNYVEAGIIRNLATLGVTVATKEGLLKATLPPGMSDAKIRQTIGLLEYKNIQALEIEGRKFQSVEDLAKLPDLVDLRIDGGFPSKDARATFQKLTHLKRVYLSFGDYGNLTSFAGAPNLMSLTDLGTVLDMSAIRDMKGLKYANLSLQSRDLPWLAGLSRLEAIFLSVNDTDQEPVVPAAIFKDMSELRVLSISNATIDDFGALLDLKSIRTIDLQDGSLEPFKARVAQAHVTVCNESLGGDADKCHHDTEQNLISDSWKLAR